MKQCFREDLQRPLGCGVKCELRSDRTKNQLRWMMQGVVMRSGGSSVSLRTHTQKAKGTQIVLVLNPTVPGNQRGMPGYRWEKGRWGDG